MGDHEYIIQNAHMIRAPQNESSLRVAQDMVGYIIQNAHMMSAPKANQVFALPRVWGDETGRWSVRTTSKICCTRRPKVWS